MALEPIIQMNLKVKTKFIGRFLALAFAATALAAHAQIEHKSITPGTTGIFREEHPAGAGDALL